MAEAFLEAVSDLPEGASLVRGSRFTMPVATAKAELSWEEGPIGEALSQAHTYAWMLEKLISSPPTQMRQGGFLAVLAHMSELVGPFYAQLTLCHFLLFYPALAAPPGSELVAPGARICGPGTAAALIKLGIPTKLHLAALRLVCDEWQVAVKPVWDAHRVPELEAYAKLTLLKMVTILRAEMIPCAIPFRSPDPCLFAEQHSVVCVG